MSKTRGPTTTSVVTTSVRRCFGKGQVVCVVKIFTSGSCEDIVRGATRFTSQVLAVRAPSGVETLPTKRLTGAIDRCGPGMRTVSAVGSTIRRTFSLTKRRSIVVTFNSLSFVKRVASVMRGL